MHRIEVWCLGGSRGTHSRTVPARNGTDVSYIWETGDLPEGLPAVFCNEAVCTIRAGGGKETGVWVIVLGVISDCLGLDRFALLSEDTHLGRRTKEQRSRELRLKLRCCTSL
jgi:hypothetical protein